MAEVGAVHIASLTSSVRPNAFFSQRTHRNPTTTGPPDPDLACSIALYSWESTPSKTQSVRQSHDLSRHPVRSRNSCSDLHIRRINAAVSSVPDAFPTPKDGWVDAARSVISSSSWAIFLSHLIRVVHASHGRRRSENQTAHLRPGRLAATKHFANGVRSGLSEAHHEYSGSPHGRRGQDCPFQRFQKVSHAVHLGCERGFQVSLGAPSPTRCTSESRADFGGAAMLESVAGGHTGTPHMASNTMA